MPYIIRPPRTRNLVACLAVALTALGCAPALASASPACPAEESAQQLFAAYGDSHYYTLLPGSNFQSGASGWSLRRASVQNDTQTNPITGSPRALVIEADGEAVSPAFCVSSENPTFRLFAHRVGDGYGRLNVGLRWTESWGATREMTSDRLDLESAWALTPLLQLGSMLPLWQPGATLKVRVVLRPELWNGAVAVNGVYIDPYRK